MALVIKLRNNVKKRVNIQDVAAGLNVRRIIEKAVFDELCAMLDRCGRLTNPKPLKWVSKCNANGKSESSSKNVNGKRTKHTQKTQT